jgi:hypothetical protein
MTGRPARGKERQGFSAGGGKKEVTRPGRPGRLHAASEAAHHPEDGTMSEHYQTERTDRPVPDVSWAGPALPDWLRERHLDHNEKVAWVYGPASNPSWERYVTHPALLLYTLAVGLVVVAGATLARGSWTEGVTVVAFLCFLLVIASIFVLAVFNGHFTRLVVTDRRLMILQGYEIVSSWKMNELPATLLRYTRRDGERASPSIDLDAVKNMLGGGATGIVEAKSILAFGKTLNQALKKGSVEHPPSEGRVDRGRILDDFEAAWARGEQPDVADYLPGGPERRAVLLELARVDLQQRLRAGLPGRVEDYLRQFPELASDRRAVLDLLVWEYDLRRRTDSGLNAREFHRRFPDLGDELAARFSRLA